jgi:hypothetical protein
MRFASRAWHIPSGGLSARGGPDSNVEFSEEQCSHALHAAGGLHGDTPRAREWPRGLPLIASGDGTAQSS